MLLVLGFFMILAGIIIIVTAAALSANGSGSSGGIIFIGPIPIAFGTGPCAQWLILFAIILAVVSIAMLMIMRRRLDKEAG